MKGFEHEERTNAAADDPDRRTFRRRDALHQWELHFGPNMTPMVDVVMVILIFFMASTVILGPEWFLGAELPGRERPAEQTEPDERFTLPAPEFAVRLYTEDGATRIDGLGRAGMTIETFEGAIARLADDLGEAGRADVTVVLEPGPGVAYRDVVRAHDAAGRAGFQRVGLRADEPPGDP